MDRMKATGGLAAILVVGVFVVGVSTSLAGFHNLLVVGVLGGTLGLCTLLAYNLGLHR